MGPRLAAIGRLVDPVANRRVTADTRLPHADIDDIGIGRRDVDGADGARIEGPVGDIAPVDAAILRLPHTAARRALEEDHLVDRIAGNGENASTARRTDGTPLGELEIRRVDDLARRDPGNTEDDEDEEEKCESLAHRRSLPKNRIGSNSARVMSGERSAFRWVSRLSAETHIWSIHRICLCWRQR